MARSKLNQFFLSIVLPSILAILFFLLMIFLVILPSSERSIMEGKKETISELTNTAWSLMEEYRQEVADGRMTESEAKQKAAERIGLIRYGDEYKDYFWIITSEPRMIMHPYRSELIGESLLDYEDPEGKRLFVESAVLVAEQQEGFIYYMWQWKDDSTRIVPKLSYVKGFEAWNWIIGTGIYLEDVRLEINVLKRKLLVTTLFFALLIGLVLVIIIRQSLRIEHKRSAAEERLMRSRQKYKSLVEASTEGTLMVVGENIIFSNFKFAALSGYEIEALDGMGPHALLGDSWEAIKSSFGDPKRSTTHELYLQCKTGEVKEVVVSASRMPYIGSSAIVLVFKEVSGRELLQREAILLQENLEMALLLMNQSVEPLMRELVRCDATSTVQEAATIMMKRKSDVIFLEHEGTLIGYITSNELSERILAPGASTSKPVMEVMSAPIKRISADSRLYESILAMKMQGVSHLVVTGSSGDDLGIFSREELMEVQYNTVDFMASEIDQAHDIETLKGIYQRLPVLIRALLDSGHKTRIVNRVITTIADAIHARVVQLVMDTLGNPPVEFALMVMGSEGRGEQTLATDQDNGIIFRDIDPGEEEQVEVYFEKFSQRVSSGLDRIGYRLCKGEVMASNPLWRKSVSGWKQQFSHWVVNSSPQDILEASIFFDFRCVFGEEQLVAQLRDHVHEISHGKAVFHLHLAQSALGFKPPQNIFGNLLGMESSSETRFDVKKLLIPLVSYVRTYAIIEKLPHTGTLDRLEALGASSRIPLQSVEEIGEAYQVLMRVRLWGQLMSIAENETPGNEVAVSALSKSDLSQLKRALSTISDLQARLKLEFKGVE